MFTKLTTGKPAGVLIFCAMVWGASGCGGSGDRPELGSVKGTVTLDGEPLTGVIIRFQPQEGRAATAVTDAQGRYVLVYRHGVNGAKLGTNTVSFEWPLGEEGKRIPDDYGVKSEVTREVQKGSNTFDFDLKSE